MLDAELATCQRWSLDNGGELECDESEAVQSKAVFGKARVKLHCSWHCLKIHTNIKRNFTFKAFEEYDSKI